MVSVRLTIGAMRDIVDEMLRSCFEYLARGTVAAGAQIDIDRVPLTLCCRCCGTAFEASALSSETITCPHCEKRNYAICSGMEFCIDRIEIL